MNMNTHASECISVPASEFLGGTASLGCLRKLKHDEVTHSHGLAPQKDQKTLGSSLEVDYRREAGDNERNRGTEAEGDAGEGEE